MTHAAVIEPIHSERYPVAAMLYNGMIGLVSPETMTALGLAGFRELNTAEVALNRHMRETLARPPEAPPTGKLGRFTAMFARAPQPLTKDEKKATCKEAAERMDDNVTLDPTTQLLTVKPELADARLRMSLEVVLKNIAEVTTVFVSDPARRSSVCQELFHGLLQRAVNVKGDSIGAAGDASATHRALIRAHWNRLSGRGSRELGRP